MRRRPLGHEGQDNEHVTDNGADATTVVKSGTGGTLILTAANSYTGGTVFNAGTTNVLTVDDGNTANKYLGASDVTEGTVGVYPTGGAGPFKAEPTARTLTAKFAQTGTAATTGSARVYALISSAAV